MTFKEWFESQELDRRVDNDYTENDIRAAWIAATLAFREEMTQYARKVDRRDGFLQEEKNNNE